MQHAKREGRIKRNMYQSEKRSLKDIVMRHLNRETPHETNLVRLPRARNSSRYNKQEDQDTRKKINSPIYVGEPQDLPFSQEEESEFFFLHKKKHNRISNKQKRERRKKEKKKKFLSRSREEKN